MPCDLRLLGPRQLALVPYEDGPLQAGEVRASAILSGISHGTELNLYRGTAPFAGKQFDRELRLFLPSASSPDSVGLGYEWVGRITEVGSQVTHLRVGDRVHLMLPHRQTHTVDPLQVPYRAPLEALPAELEPEQSIFLALAGVALQAIHDARIKVGDRVAVFGLGVIGQFVVQLARLNGAAWIDAVDPIARRRQLAGEFGADQTWDPGAADVGLGIKSASAQHGADVAIEVSGHYPALHEAIRCVRQAGLVVAAGFYQEGGASLRLGEEWHHNRVTMVSSMAVWQNPHRDYPLWDRRRIDQVAISLMLSGRLQTGSMLTHRFAFEEANAAYELIDRYPERAMKVALTY